MQLVVVRLSHLPGNDGMEPIDAEITLRDTLLQGSLFLRLRRIVGAVALLAGALALLMHGPGLLH